MRLSPLCAAIGCLPLLTGGLAAQERSLRADPVAEGVYVVASSNIGDPNVLVVAGPDRLLLVDGIWAEAVGELLTTVRTRSTLPIGDLVLTHWHPDHSQGNAVLRAEGITIWAHENAQQRMRTGNPIAYFALDIPAYPADALADRTLATAHTLTVGQEPVHLIPLPPAHTDGDVVVHLPRANVIHVGDLQLAGMYPFVELSSGGDVDGLIAAFDQVLALADENTVIVPGHGPVGRRADLQEYRNLLATVWERVKEHAGQGKSLEEVVALRPAAEFDARWSSPLIPTDRFVGILYEAASAGR